MDILDTLQKKHILPEEKHNEIYKEKILSTYHSDIPPADNPKCVIVSGQTASGKSSIITGIQDEFYAANTGAVYICSDNFRALHPAYENIQKIYPQFATYAVDADAKKWVDELLQDSIRSSKNIIFENTLKDTNKIIGIIQQLKSRQYTVELAVMAVPPVISKIGMFLRYESEVAKKGYGRWIEPDIHDDRVKNMPIAINTIQRANVCDDITLYKRVINADKFTAAPFAKNNNLYFRYRDEINRTLSDTEITMITQMKNQVLQLLEQRHANPDFFLKSISNELGKAIQQNKGKDFEMGN